MTMTDDDAGPPGVAPTASPPITIGPFTNVPAPGSPIRSDWPQSISNFVTPLPNGVTRWSHKGATLESVIGPLVQTRAAVTSTNAAGEATLTFMYPFLGDQPIVVVVGYEATFAHHFTVKAITNNDFTVLVRTPGGTPAASTTTVPGYIAFGKWA